MDFSDKQFDKVKHFSTSRLTKLAGNSIVVDVLEAVFRQLFRKSKSETLSNSTKPFG